MPKPALRHSVKRCSQSSAQAQHTQESDMHKCQSCGEPQSKFGECHRCIDERLKSSTDYMLGQLRTTRVDIATVAMQYIKKPESKSKKAKPTQHRYRCVKCATVYRVRFYAGAMNREACVCGGKLEHWSSGRPRKTARSNGEGNE